ncbi:MAG TPA: phosphotransferase family protein [Candidatus Hydrogenedentes bacterium]|nr:phosphotransferase family protein [Candidatus Hydrogenedentota bacterium]
MSTTPDMTAILDEPRDVRPGEELDAARLSAYLHETIPGIEGPIEIRQFPSGFSNLTYLVRVGDRDLILRRPPAGSKVKSAHDMGREFRILNALRPVYPPVPQPLAYCPESDVIGAPFYVMERIKGVILRGKKPAGFHCPPDLARRCCVSFIENFAHLHAINYEAIGLADMRKEGSFVRRQVEGWIDRYHGSQTDDIPAMEQAAAYMKENCPADTGSVLIHNDYKFDNLVLNPADPTHIVGVLDWEMATIGDPLMDLGVVLSYWNEPKDPNLGIVPCFLTLEPGCMTRREIADTYAERTGRDLSNLSFYHVFGLFKLAVIAQQIYYRYKQGLTRDERFGALLFVVATLAMTAVRIAENGDV